MSGVPNETRIEPAQQTTPIRFLKDTTLDYATFKAGDEASLAPADATTLIEKGRAEPVEGAGIVLADGVAGSDDAVSFTLSRKDDEQILAQIKGEAVEEYVYEYEQGGRKIRGISYSGTRRCAQLMGGIEVDQPNIREMDDRWRVLVKVHDKIADLTFWGVADQAKQMKVYRRDPQNPKQRLVGSNGKFLFDMVEDEFALQKAVSKAQRNGLNMIVPESIKMKLLENPKIKERLR